MDTTPAQNQAQPRGERLDSWKEIAAYLKRDIRTVQRWEKQEGLPVHRHLHDERGTAYAYAGEIDEWLRRRSRSESAAASASDVAESGRVEPPPVAPPVPEAKRESWRLAISMALALAVVAGVISLWAFSRSRSAAPPLSSLSVVFAPSERLREWGPDMALSPDGSTLVYITLDGQLNVRRIDQLSSRALPGTAGWGPFFSPDGRWIGFNREGRLMKVPVEGGAPVDLGVTAAFIGAADWGTDDHIVFATTTPQGTHGLYRVPASGGTPRLVAALDGAADDAYWLTPQSLSNGNVILCTVARTAASGARFQMVAVSVGTGERRLLVDDARHGFHVGEGVLVYWRGGSLFATRLDPDRVEITGPHVPAWDEVWERVRMRSWTSAAGTLVYWPTAPVAHRLAWVDRSGKQEVLPLPPAMYHAPRVSPDGRSIAYHIGSGSHDVWTYEPATGSTVRLTADGRSATPMWASDGTRLIISWLRANGRDLAHLRLSGTAEPELLGLPGDFLPGAEKQPASWAEGGRTLIVRQTPPARGPGLWAVPLDGSRPPYPVGPANATHGQVSPDSRWIVYTAPELPGGRSEVYVTSYPSGRQQWTLSTDGGAVPIWSRSGREVFYRRGDSMMAVAVAAGETFAAATPRQLFEVSWFEADPGSPNYDVSPDDQRFLVVLPSRPDGAERLNVIQGWRAELHRRLREGR